MNNNALAAAITTLWVFFLIAGLASYLVSGYLFYRIGRKFGIGSLGQWYIPFYNSLALQVCGPFCLELPMVVSPSGESLLRRLFMGDHRAAPRS
jgi:hypothetical protein